MKKFFKVIVALIVIVGIAFGVYMIFGRGTDNKQIYAKVYDLNNSVIVEEVNIFQKTNATIEEMLSYINIKGYNIPEAQNYLIAFLDTLNVYSIVQGEVLKFGVFVNNESTRVHFDAMNSAYSKLVEDYKAGHEYLQGTYYAITDESMINKDYIENFCNVFSGALANLNDFYYNVARAYALGSKNMITNTNLNKLNVGLYGAIANYYVNDYIDNGTFNSAILSKLLQQGTKVNSKNFDEYAQNKQEYDELIISAEKLDLQNLAVAYVLGTTQDFIDSLKDDLKEIANQYCTLVLN